MNHRLIIDTIYDREAIAADRGNGEEQYALAIRYLTNCYCCNALGNPNAKPANSFACHYWLARAFLSGLQKEVKALAKEHPEELSIRMVRIQRDLIRKSTPKIPDNVIRPKQWG